MDEILLSFSKREVTRAGQVLRTANPDGEDFAEARTVAEHWRSCHISAKEEVLESLRKSTELLGISAHVVARLKRFPAMLSKLSANANFRLGELQDIAGCRIIVPTIGEMNAVSRKLIEQEKDRAPSVIDYITKPKDSGYRSLHIVLRREAARVAPFPPITLRVEVQLRTELQHCWAAAIETVTLFRGENIKAGEGDADWLRLFSLVSSIFSRREGYGFVPGTPTEDWLLIDELAKLARKLKAVEYLKSWTKFIDSDKYVSDSKETIFLVTVTPSDGGESSSTIFGFAEHQTIEATRRFNAAEREIDLDSRTQITLVNLSEIQELRQAFPSYANDASTFIYELEEMLLTDAPPGVDPQDFDDTYDFDSE